MKDFFIFQILVLNALNSEEVSDIDIVKCDDELDEEEDDYYC